MLIEIQQNFFTFPGNASIFKYKSDGLKRCGPTFIGLVRSWNINWNLISEGLRSGLLILVVCNPFFKEKETFAFLILKDQTFDQVSRNCGFLVCTASL